MRNSDKRRSFQFKFGEQGEGWRRKGRVPPRTTLMWMCRTDVDRLIDQILLEEPLISESRKPQLKKLIEKLIEK